MSAGRAGGVEVAVVGAGHNGLVAALRLARAGCTVTVLEQAGTAGGCVWTEDHPSGVLVERGAYEHGGMRAVATELGLDDPDLGPDALRYVEHPVAAGFLFGNGRRRVFHTDLARTLAGLDPDDRAGYRRLTEQSGMLFGLLDTFQRPPSLTRVAAALADVAGGDQLFRTLLQPAETVIASQLADPLTRAALELQAAHSQVPAWAPGSGMFAFLLPSAHAAPAVRPVGGSRALTRALLAALAGAGGTVLTDAPVSALGSGVAVDRDVAAAPVRPRLAAVPPSDRPEAPSPVAEARVGVFGGSPGARTVPPRDVTGFDWTDRPRVRLADGSGLEVDAVVSTLGAPRTAALLTDPAPALRAAAADLHSGHFNVAELTVTLVGSSPLELPFDEDPLAIWYAVDDPADVRRGFGELVAGQLPSAPWSMVGQVAQPDGVDGGAIWLSSVVPLRRADGPWTVDLERAAAERLVDHVGRVLRVDLRAGLVDLVVSGPVTWAQRVGGDGNPNHLDNTVDQLLGWRVPGHADLRTELPWLFLAGAGQHPGGGLTGASGSAVAAAVLTSRGAPARRADRILAETRALWRGWQGYRAMRR